MKVNGTAVTYKWEAVTAITDNEGDLYIYLDKLLALIFPSSCFNNSLEKETLIKYAEENLHNKGVKWIQ